MNYLAHIFLSGDQAEILVGNFLGDLITNKEKQALPDAIKFGVDLHRRIDTYTDNHASVLRSVSRIRDLHGKYAPVVVDVLYDHLLSLNWDTFSTEKLEDFSSRSYGQILDHMEFIPERRRARVASMIEHDWLRHYGNLEALHGTFLRLKKRAKFQGNFELAVSGIVRQFEGLQADFLEFFPDLRKMSQEFIQSHGH